MQAKPTLTQSQLPWMELCWVNLNDDVVM